MASSTSSRRRRAIATPCLVLVALLGTWLGHTIEILLQQRSMEASIANLHLSPSVSALLLGREMSSMSIAPFGGIHNYMVGVGAVLLIASLVAGVTLWTAWEALAARLDRIHRKLGAIFRNRVAEQPDAALLVSLPARFLSVWGLLTAAQIVLYAIQENIETVASGGPVPGVGVLGGNHSMAPLVHAAVALLLSAAVLAVARVFRAKVAEIVTLERQFARRYRAIWGRCSRPVRRAGTPHIPALADLIGSDRWQRPPPVCA